jgi:hypothetical protein
MLRKIVQTEFAQVGEYGPFVLFQRKPASEPQR